MGREGQGSHGVRHVVRGGRGWVHTGGVTWYGEGGQGSHGRSHVVWGGIKGGKDMAERSPV